MNNKQLDNLLFLLSIDDYGEFDFQEIEKKDLHNIKTEKKTKKPSSSKKEDNYWQEIGILPKEIYDKVSKAKDTNNLLQIINSVKNYPLKDNAQNTVFSAGKINSKVMVIGEAPGAEEDKQGLPFVGDSGKLLESMLNLAGFYREKNIYISNILPWRPPNNQTPTTEEIQTCLPFLIKHISLVKPEFILMVGSVPSKALVNDPKIKITQARGLWFEQTFIDHKVKMLATYHPSFLLRQPRQKKLFWQDVLSLKRCLI